MVVSPGSVNTMAYMMYIPGYALEWRTGNYCIGPLVFLGYLLLFASGFWRFSLPTVLIVDAGSSKDAAFFNGS